MRVRSRSLVLATFLAAVVGVCSGQNPPDAAPDARPRPPYADEPYGSLHANSIQFVPSRLLNWEFQSIALAYERVLTSAFSAEVGLGLPLTPERYRATNASVAGYEAVAAVRYYLPVSDATFGAYLRLGGEVTRQPVAVDAYVKRGLLPVGTLERVDLDRRRNELQLGFGMKLLLAGRVSLDVTASGVAYEAGLFSQGGGEVLLDRAGVRDARLGEAFGRYDSLLFARLRLGIGLAF